MAQDRGFMPAPCGSNRDGSEHLSPGRLTAEAPVSHQNIIFSPTKTRRSSWPVCVELTVPNKELVGVTFGGEKFG
jgi:hypothetical protein